eukprot:TRINITY_DN150_c0_g1_i1.p3 TRINITY_DN150_c0_g1~~TRINITY_DN150_c0_g1_i1.p3  ORF type:complete len:104 (+),score=42.27 TRINITY_DN150_c0_g1_i1:85-396(+)
MAEQFNKAVYLVREGPKRDSSNDQKLKFYGLYKQATIGDVQGDQPWAVQVEARAKWDAWAAQKGKSKEAAMAAYVAAVAEGDANWEQSETVKNMPAGWTPPSK